MAWAAGRTGNGVFVTAPGNPASTTAWIDGGQVGDPAALTGAAYRVTVNGATAVVDRLGAGDTVAATTTLLLQPGTALEVDGMAFTIRGAPAQGDTFTIEPSTPSLNVFDVLDTAISQLRTTGQSSAQRSQAIATGLRDMDSALTLVQGARSRVGAMLDSIDQTESRIADLRLYGQKERSAAEDLDMTAAVSDFQNQQTGYDAALRSYALVQRMSLFDYING
jgi:flagellar hook-associated protein 3 FlgL